MANEGMRNAVQNVESIKDIAAQTVVASPYWPNSPIAQLSSSMTPRLGKTIPNNMWQLI